MSEVVDCFGREAQVGQLVAFAQANRGAQEFIQGEIVKVNKKTVEIEDEDGYPHRRGSGCYVLDIFGQVTRELATYHSHLIDKGE